MLWTNDLENLYLEIVGCSLVKGNFVSLLPWSSLNDLSSQYSREIKERKRKERREKNSERASRKADDTLAELCSLLRSQHDKYIASEALLKILKKKERKGFRDSLQETPKIKFMSFH